METPAMKEITNSGEDTRIVELQRLVQSLQLKNEQLMAAMNGQSGGDVGHGPVTNSVDFPRDSGIDLSASCSDEVDDEIIDLDRFDMPDDEESWLYATPAAKSQGDVLSWLRKDVNSLDPVYRRALAVKIEMLLAKKQGDSRKSANAHFNVSPPSVNTGQNGSMSATSFPAMLDLEEEGLLSIEPVLLSDNDTGHAISRHTTFRVERSKLSGTNSPAATLSTATYSRPKKTTSGVKGVTPPPTQVIQKPDPQQVEIGPTALSYGSVGDGAMLTLGGQNSVTKATPEMMHPELNPNLHDIQLLASLQEEELRRCLLNLQQMNRRRRTSSGNQKDLEPGSDVHNSSITNAPTAASGKLDPYGTYTKPKQQLRVKNGGINNINNGQVAPKVGNVASRKSVSTTAQPQIQPQLIEDINMASQKVAGLQKSLPNLMSGSKSEFNLPAPSFPADTASEKGSYGDIPSVLNPAGLTQTAASSASRLGGSSSRLPTPARSRLPTPAKSGIPVSRVGNSLSVTTSKSRKSSVSPAPKSTNVNGQRHGTKVDNWKDGCF